MSSTAPRSLLVSRRVLVALGFVFIAPWIMLLVVIRDLRPPAPAADAPAPATVAVVDDGTVQANHGPWGDLVYSRILIEPPEDLVGVTRMPTGPLRWLFKGYTAKQITALWTAAGLPPDVVAELDAPTNRSVHGETTEVRVRYDLALNLTSDARATIYDALAAFPENEFQAEPFRFRADAVDEWFSESGVAPEIVELVKRMLYRRGPAVLFADLEIVLTRLPSLEERTTLIKTLARKGTLLVRLLIDENTDIDALTAYWGRGHRSKDVRPLLQSLRRKGVVTRIDIAHLLPRFARARLYSYPSEAEAADLEFMDCHWTSMNFFNLEPDDRFRDINVVSETILHDYRLVTGPPAFGDLLLFARPDGSILHSCIYIADDIVFSKNGVSPAAPWILMNLTGVQAIYPTKEPLEIQRYRSKALP